VKPIVGGQIRDIVNERLYNILANRVWIQVMHQVEGNSFSLFPRRGGCPNATVALRRQVARELRRLLINDFKINATDETFPKQERGRENR